MPEVPNVLEYSLNLGKTGQGQNVHLCKYHGASLLVQLAFCSRQRVLSMLLFAMFAVLNMSERSRQAGRNF